MQFSRIFSATLLAALLAACTTTPPEKPTEPQKTQIVFKRVDFSALPTMPDQNWEPALEALKISCRKMSAQAGWEDVCAKASRTTAFEAKEFFLENNTFMMSDLLNFFTIFMVFIAILGGIFYYISYRFMSKRLNLE